MDYKSQILTEDFFKGDYHGSGDFFLSGKFVGGMTIDNLVIQERGEFIGKIVAKSIIVEGILKADVEVDKIHIKGNGIVDGELLYRNLIIEEGGSLKSLKVIKMSDTKAVKKFKSL
tara:strand:- start:894 stop:1241 length:348 start_codon:yes stop_codon:yes gene_type:complete